MRRHPCGLWVIFGYAKYRDWRWRKYAHPIFRDATCAPLCHHLGRQHAVRCLTRLKNQGIQVHQAPNAIGQSFCNTRNGQSAKAMAHQNNILHALRQHVLHDVIDIMGQRQMVGGQVPSVAKTCLSGRGDVVTVVTQALCNQAPAPPTMKATMNQNKIQDQSLEIENLSAIQWVSRIVITRATGMTRRHQRINKGLVLSR